MEQIIKQLRIYGQKHQIPILEDEGVDVLSNILLKTKPQRILELGTAIGYSALIMYHLTHAQIYTIERDEKRYKIAHEVFTNLNLPINLILADALEVDNTNWGLFDIIYFDAAKAQNKNFFNKYQINLKPQGLIIIDNLFFHGIVEQKQSEIKSRNMRQLSRKINDFISFCQTLEGYQFLIIDKGDGIGILIKE